MDIRMDWDLRITVDDLKKKAACSPDNTRMLRVYDEIVELGSKLAKPASVTECFEIARVEEGRVVLEDGSSFNSLHLSTLLEGADRIVLMCGTIGPALEETAASLSAEGDTLRAYLLDTYGSVAVNSLFRKMYQSARNEFPGLGATVTMSPGQLDWDVKEQDTLFRLLSPGKIGVTLTPSSMMKPIKSATDAFGIGDPSRVRRGHFACESCTRRNVCAYRSQDDELEGPA
ncbi:MAG: hypothetical protein ACM3X4_09895 [Ignavibacteriales bacterium]